MNKLDNNILNSTPLLSRKRAFVPETLSKFDSPHKKQKLESEKLQINELAQVVSLKTLSQQKLNEIFNDAEKDYKDLKQLYQKSDDLKFISKSDSNVTLSKPLLRKIIQISHLLLNETPQGTFKRFKLTNEEGIELEFGVQKDEFSRLRIIQFLDKSNSFLGAGSFGTVHKIMHISEACFAALKVSLDLPDLEKKIKRSVLIEKEFRKLILFNNQRNQGLQPPAMDFISFSPEQSGFISKLFNKSSLDTGINDLHLEVLTQQELLKLCITLINGLDSLHSNNIIHGDIKPANCFLNIINDGNSKIIELVLGDLGGATEKKLLVKTKDPIGTQNTNGFFTLGDRIHLDKTKAKQRMSKEKTKYSNKLFELNEKRDVFALAATLWYMITKQTPYEKEVNGRYPITDQLKNKDIVINSIGSSAAEVLIQALNENPKERPNIKNISNIFISEYNKNALDKPFIEFKTPEPQLKTLTITNPISPSKTKTLSQNSPSPVKPIIARRRIGRPILFNLN